MGSCMDVKQFCIIRVFDIAKFRVAETEVLRTIYGLLRDTEILE